MVDDWDDFLIPYKQAVDELKVKLRGIRAQFLKIDGRSPIEFVTGRVKPVDSIKEKWSDDTFKRIGWKKTWKILPVFGLCASLLKIFIKLLTFCGSEPISTSLKNATTFITKAEWIPFLPHYFRVPGSNAGW